MRRIAVRPGRAFVLGCFVATLVLVLMIPSVALAAGMLPVYRFFNVKTGTHFYTADEAEKNNVIAKYGYKYRFEGISYYLAP